MTKIMKQLVLTVLIVGVGTSAYALDTFTNSTTLNAGLNAADMAVTPSGAALANAAIPATGPSSADGTKMMPMGGANNNNPGSGLRADFNSTGVANAFAYNVAGSAFQFPTGAGGATPQGTAGGGTTTCPTCPPPPDPSPNPNNSRVDQLVSKYTASSGFTQNFHNLRVITSTATNPGGANQSVGLLTLEQGDSDMENEGGFQTGFFQVFKSEVRDRNGAESGNGGLTGVGQLVQQSDPDIGPFSSCLECNNVTPVVAFFARQDTGPSFTPDTVSHPGP